MIKTIFNIIAICGAAGFAGVMLCIGVTLGGYWKSLPIDEFLDWFAANNQFIARSIPIIFVPTFICVLGSIWFSWGESGFKLWAASGLCILVVAILTFAFFVPANTQFASGMMDLAVATDKLNQWLNIHNFRVGFAALAAVLGCLAIKV